ncbi:MAG: cytochrome bc complex cytochrome b subunit [Deltaproteobacteria bacterium]|nr:cytochrome bc complex cytochrome b subunit [Deltaproteobacteria bacterium]
MSYPRLKNWLDERYDLTDVKKFAKSKLIPEHRYDLLYYTGGITLFLFVLQFITGMLLAMYYVPHIDHAYESIIEIVTKINLGWFFRSLHHWGAQLTILFLFIHLFGTLLVKAYRKPREMVWITGFILLIISIFFGLSGYLLLWDERAFAAVRVATGGAGALPVFGGFIKAFLRGGMDVTGDTIVRFYAFHVSILPLLSLLMIGLHVLLVQYHGVSVPRSEIKDPQPTVPFFPNVFYKDMIIWLIVLGVVVTLAVLAPPEIGIKADPLAPPPANIKPEWYFLMVLETLKLFPGTIFGLNGETIAIICVVVGISFLFLIPFFDRKANRGEESTVFTVIAVIYVVYFVVMTAVGFLS